MEPRLDNGHSMKVINLFGGFGTGKSTLAIGLTGAMRKAGLRADHLLDALRLGDSGKSWGRLDDDSLQIAQIQSAMGKARNSALVDFLVVESPVLMRLAYLSKEHAALSEIILGLHRQDDSANIFLERDANIALDKNLEPALARGGAAILEILKAHSPDFFRITAGDGALEAAFRAVRSMDERAEIGAAAKQADRDHKPRML